MFTILISISHHRRIQNVNNVDCVQVLHLDIISVGYRCIRLVDLALLFFMRNILEIIY